MVWNYGSKLDELLHELGDATHLAERTVALRAERGWSQGRLADELAKVGSPMPQSSISRLESPDPTARRGVLIGEALSLSRVFGVPLAELLLPAAALRQMDLIRALAVGPSYRAAVGSARHAYRRHVAETAALAASSTEAGSILAEQNDVIVDRCHSAAATDEDRLRRDFLRDVTETHEEIREGRVHVELHDDGEPAVEVVWLENTKVGDEL